MLESTAEYIRQASGATLLTYFLGIPAALYSWVLLFRSLNEAAADEIRATGTRQERHPDNAPLPKFIRFFKRCRPFFLFAFVSAVLIQIILFITPESLMQSRPLSGSF